MNRVLMVSYLKKYSTVLMVLGVALSITLIGSALNNWQRSKEIGVIDKCGRSVTSEPPELQDCIAEKIVRGFPIKTTVNYKITHKPTDQPAVKDTLRVRYSSTKNPLYDASNYLITGFSTVLIGLIALQAADRIKKFRTRKIK